MIYNSILIHINFLFATFVIKSMYSLLSICKNSIVQWHLYLHSSRFKYLTNSIKRCTETYHIILVVTTVIRHALFTNNYVIPQIHAAIFEYIRIYANVFIVFSLINNYFSLSFHDLNRRFRHLMKLMKISS